MLVSMSFDDKNARNGHEWIRAAMDRSRQENQKKEEEEEGTTTKQRPVYQPPRENNLFPITLHKLVEQTLPLQQQL